MNAKKRKDLRDRITSGVKAGVAAALEEHRRAGRSVAIWQDGRVRIVSAEIPSQETTVLRDQPNEK
jgi:hypothetical protein